MTTHSRRELLQSVACDFGGGAEAWILQCEAAFANESGSN